MATKSLQVIALISGGKDSFYSVLHCIQNGHQVVALGNLYPAPPAPSSAAASHSAESDDERDLNSFMYQTVGHTVIPLYEQALGIPLYRQQIVGSAVQTGISYGFADVKRADEEGSATKDGEALERGEDETESLVPLLTRIMAEHPTANALSTGAILSTYQRTRVESVALRLGLTPLSYLWQYPILPPGAQISLLEDMQSVGLDARIVKVASGGLDESFLWQNVASQQVMRRVEKSMRRFGTDGDGAVLGEGGEFETLVVDGPACLFKGRIEVLEKDRRVVREGGGSAWLKILEARVVMKGSVGVMENECRVPELLEPRFTKILAALERGGNHNSSLNSWSTPNGSRATPFLHSPILSPRQAKAHHLLHWSVTAKRSVPGSDESISVQASRAIEEIAQRLQLASLQPTSIVATVIILRSMQDFASVNKIYGSLFTKPNPPSRVTISSGSLLPDDTSLIIHLTLHDPPAPSNHPHKALHVQSRSYWAPANIGPYSQAISVPVLPSLASSSPPSSQTSTVFIAGQIPLIPHTMALPPCSLTDSPHATADFNLQAVLSLQHLIRIAQETHVKWFTSCAAFLPSAPLHTIAAQARILSQAWKMLHTPGEQDDDDEEEQDRDLWEEKHYAGMEVRGAGKAARSVPDWEVLSSVHDVEEEGERCPPFWSVEVEELPRGAGVEWAAGWGVTGGL
ncbi:hypothetical protein LZ554_002333 [Drepanopeziza brunnea f. sp. 'monogermtubi']|nr:hypothetical protein LZ554_002333 [Drepanopeziza brunnea f. sp. 'monogermtubi']